jgi:hypothetical protein
VVEWLIARGRDCAGNAGGKLVPMRGLAHRSLDLMNKRFWISLACLGACASHADAAERAIFFSTQDANGFYTITFTHGKAGVLGRIGQTRVDRMEDYDTQKVQRLYDEMENLAKDGLNGPVDDAHAHVALNYVIILRAPDGTKTNLSFPKCARNPRVDDVMKRLTEGLLPAGSPGIFPGTCSSGGAS